MQTYFAMLPSKLGLLLAVSVFTGLLLFSWGTPTPVLFTVIAAIGRVAKPSARGATANTTVFPIATSASAILIIVTCGEKGVVTHSHYEHLF